jgi:hypothetical protein
VFKFAFVPSPLPIVVMMMVMMLLTLAIGTVGSRGVHGQSSLEVLRNEV